MVLIKIQFKKYLKEFFGIESQNMIMILWKNILNIENWKILVVIMSKKDGIIRRV